MPPGYPPMHPNMLAQSMMAAARGAAPALAGEVGDSKAGDGAKRPPGLSLMPPFPLPLLPNMPLPPSPLNLGKLLGVSR